MRVTLRLPATALAAVLLLCPAAATTAAADSDAARRQFEQAMTLANRGQQDRAIEIFRKLIAEYPQWPEPYNNLAVLYARQGRYAEASQTLEAALDTHPSYSAAHKNLNLVYDAMASRTYQKAFALENSDDSKALALVMIERLDRDPTPQARPTPAVATQAPATAVATAPAAPAPVKSASPPAPAPAQPTPPSATLATAAEAAPEANAARDESALIKATVTRWAEAWSRQNVDAYLGFYGADFVPPPGLDRRGWSAQRRERLTSPGRIQVRLTGIQVTRPAADQAMVEFIQSYESDSFTGDARKQLRLRRYGTDWRIVAEQVLR